MDIALVLDRIRPNAKWRMASSYELLKATWEDTEQTIPTEAEIEVEWAKIQAENKAVSPTMEERIAAIEAYNLANMGVHS